MPEQKSERARVTVAMQITTTVEVDDTGYLGTSATVAEHIQKAANDVKNWTVLIKQGGLEPKPISAAMKILSIHIIPEES